MHSRFLPILWQAQETCRLAFLASFIDCTSHRLALYGTLLSFQRQTYEHDTATCVSVHSSGVANTGKQVGPYHNTEIQKRLFPNHPHSNSNLIHTQPLSCLRNNYPSCKCQLNLRMKPQSAGSGAESVRPGYPARAYTTFNPLISDRKTAFGVSRNPSCHRVICHPWPSRGKPAPAAFALDQCGPSPIIQS